MESYTYLLLLAVILLSTKVFGLLTEHVHLPQVVGALRRDHAHVHRRHRHRHE